MSVISRQHRISLTPYDIVASLAVDYDLLAAARFDATTDWGHIADIRDAVAEGRYGSIVAAVTAGIDQEGA